MKLVRLDTDKWIEIPITKRYQPPKLTQMRGQSWQHDECYIYETKVIINYNKHHNTHFNFCFRNQWFTAPMKYLNDVRQHKIALYGIESWFAHKGYKLLADKEYVIFGEKSIEGSYVHYVDRYNEVHFNRTGDNIMRFAYEDEALHFAKHYNLQNYEVRPYDIYYSSSVYYG